MDRLRELTNRGLVYQLTDEDELRRLLSEEHLCFYIGFDPTAGSLHIGHLVPIMVARHLQNAGHRPVMVVGGGTGLVGDPSERSAERTLESRETIEDWTGLIRSQLSSFLRFDDSPSGAVIENNASWLLGLDYIDFLRNIGRHFSVNRMLSAESVRQRLEAGLSFLEFNYMLLQAYDYLHLFRTHGCTLQVGGADQWGNIVAGVDLIRRLEGERVFGLTCPLVTTASGEKMSKTMPGGAVWLDPGMTTPYDYYQFWINVQDDDVIYFLKLYTDLPVERIEQLSGLKGRDLRKAKEILALEATTLVHGTEEAERARDAAGALFQGSGSGEAIPTLEIAPERLEEGLDYLSLFVETGLCPSRSEVRRLARQGGLYVNDTRLADPETAVSADEVSDGAILLRAGKKRYYRVSFEND